MYMQRLVAAAAGSSRSFNYRGGFGYRCLREPFADCS
jgi:hypothetical protein